MEEQKVLNLLSLPSRTFVSLLTHWLQTAVGCCAPVGLNLWFKTPLGGAGQTTLSQGLPKVMGKHKYYFMIHNNSKIAIMT